MKKNKKNKSKKLIKNYHFLLRPFVKFWRMVSNWFTNKAKINRDFKDKRPHRSFLLTRKRDSARSFKISGYFRFCYEVWNVIWKNKRIFISFTILFSILSLLIVGTLSQDNYIAIRDSITNASDQFGISELMSIFTTSITNTEDTTITSQIITGLMFIFGWLVVVWILRYSMSGHKIKLRDALYNAGSPIVATFVLLLLILLQLLPFALVLVAYVAVSGVGVINWEVAIENMAAWCALAALGILTIYWVTTSFISLVIVTNPGVYPWQAIQMASDMVVSRRLKIMLRLLFMLLPLLVLWLVVLLPIILLDNWLKLNWLPLIPLFTLFLSTISLTWIASYIFMLYRRLLDDDAPTVKK